MTAALIIDRARQSGVALERRGGRLVWRSQTTPDPGLIALCKSHKAALLEALPDADSTPALDVIASPLASWRASILAAPTTSNPELDKLAAVSLRFMDSEWASTAIASLWDAVSLFGVHKGPAPRERLDAWGLLPLLTWGTHRYSIVGFDVHACLLQTSSGSELRQPRHRANFDAALVWWSHPALGNPQSESNQERPAS
jgi:hypothetical protein